MKKHRLVTAASAVSLLILMGLSGCSSQSEPVNVAWHEQFANTVNEKNYSVSAVTTEKGKGDPITESYAEYDGSSTRIEMKADDGTSTDICYSRADKECKVIAKDTGNNIWIEKTIDEDENYFYAYSVMDRLKKYGGWIDSGKLTFDQENNTYCGKDLGEVVIDQKAHRVKALEIKIRENRIIGFKEEYAITVDGETRARTDEVSFENIGRTVITLPEDTWTEERIREYQGMIEEAAQTGESLAERIEDLQRMSAELTLRQEQSQKQLETYREKVKQSNATEGFIESLKSRLCE